MHWIVAGSRAAKANRQSLNKPAFSKCAPGFAARGALAPRALIGTQRKRNDRITWEGARSPRWARGGGQPWPSAACGLVQEFDCASRY